MWMALLIWVAKQLISYFLKTNLDLSRQLEESVKRNAEHQKALDDLEDELTILLEDQKDAQFDIDVVDANIKKLEADWAERYDKYAEAKRRNENTIDVISDDDILRADLPSTGASGFIGNLK
jgi:predicted  nucleic acid-binding Zn-ribbon protein